MDEQRRVELLESQLILFEELVINQQPLVHLSMELMSKMLSERVSVPAQMLQAYLGLEDSMKKYDALINKLVERNRILWERR